MAFWSRWYAINWLVIFDTFTPSVSLHPSPPPSSAVYDETDANAMDGQPMYSNSRVYTSNTTSGNGWCAVVGMLPAEPGDLFATVGPAGKMPLETALSIVNSAFFRAATGRNDSILTSYVVLPEVKFLPKIPTGAVGFQTFLLPLFTSLMLPLFVSFVAYEVRR